MTIVHLDHLVLTVRDIDATCVFYQQLGLEVSTFGAGRTALRFGQQKINLHPAAAPIAPHADQPTAGSADLCFLVTGSMDEVATHLQRCSIPIVEGPVMRNGATGPIESVYCRDPDGNLIELSVPQRG
jgi:catechol 2,3-dioxygenase-like lactoylglutathione lyase family enzyme